jgi:hypothetical protein
MDLSQDKECSNVLHRHLSPELNPWNYLKIKKALHRHLSPELNPWTFIKIKMRESIISMLAKLRM